jgi:toxin HigB-1
MIKTFAHKGLEQFFHSGSKAGIQPIHANRLRLQLAALDGASIPDDMNFPAWKLHPLKGEMHGMWSVWVDKNWRLTFSFRDGHAIIVNYQDYH